MGADKRRKECGMKKVDLVRRSSQIIWAPKRECRVVRGDDAIEDETEVV